MIERFIVWMYRAWNTKGWFMYVFADLLFMILECKLWEHGKGQGPVVTPKAARWLSRSQAEVTKALYSWEDGRLVCPDSDPAEQRMMTKIDLLEKKWGCFNEKELIYSVFSSLKSLVKAKWNIVWLKHKSVMFSWHWTVCIGTWAQTTVEFLPPCEEWLTY